MASVTGFEMEQQHGEKEQMFNSSETNTSEDLDETDIIYEAGSNTDMFYRQDATSEFEKVELVLDPSPGPKFFFFQVTNHKSPSGETTATIYHNYMTTSWCRQERQLQNVIISGFDSYVGEVIRVLSLEGLVDLKYRFCGSGHGRFFRNTFSPRMFHHISCIDSTRYHQLQLAYMHPVYDNKERRRHEVNLLALLPADGILDIQTFLIVGFPLSQQTMSRRLVEAYVANCAPDNYLYLEEFGGGEGIVLIRKM